jgi:hypothetical protein
VLRKSLLWMLARLPSSPRAGLRGFRRAQSQAAASSNTSIPQSQPPQPAEAIARLKLPARVGIAFVPAGRFGVRISAAERAAMLERVKGSFAIGRSSRTSR